jgi:hypothetical protein
MNHLTDEQIQEFLDNKIGQKTNNVVEHLETCAHCKKQVEAYKQVFSTLDVEPDFSLPVNFVDKVVSTVETSEDKKYKKWESVLLIFSIIQGIGLAIYFLDIKKIFSFISFEKPDFLQTTFEQINSLGNGFLPILFFAIIIITFYGFLDRFINQFKHQSS